MSQPLLPTLLDRLRRKYRIIYRCLNCGRIGEIDVPKGMSVKEFLDKGAGICDNCGVNTLELARPLHDKEKKELEEEKKAIYRLRKKRGGWGEPEFSKPGVKWKS